MHACDYVDDAGEEIDTSLAVQLESQISLRDDDDTVEGAKAKFSQMQAQMDADVEAHEQKLVAQTAEFENRKNEPDDPSKQLQGLMNAQASLKRISSAFSPKPQVELVKDMAAKLDIEMTPELLALGDNEAISNALVEIAVGMGKSEDEISKALG